MNVDRIQKTTKSGTCNQKGAININNYEFPNVAGTIGAIIQLTNPNIYAGGDL